MQTLYQIALVTHIIGLSMMAGTTLVDYVVTRQFWRQYASDRSKAIIINEAAAKFQLFFGTGIILLILSGITMMGITRGAFGQQIWFQIKFGLVILIIINGLAVGRRQGLKLRKLLSEETSGEKQNADVLKIRSKINRFHFFQITFLAIIFILSVFKFV